MTRLSEEARDKARTEMHTWRRVKRLGTLVGGVSGVVLGVLAPPLTVPIAAAVFAVITYVGEDKTDSASDKANDPPRDDYRSETVVEEPSLNLEAFGGTRLEQAAAEFLRTAERAVAYERAMVIADERAAGAELAGDESAVVDRRQEAENFGRAAADYNLGLQPRAEELAIGLEEQSELQGALAAELASPDKLQGTLRQALPEEALTYLRNVVLELSRLEIDLEAVRDLEEPGLDVRSVPLEALAVVLRDAAGASADWGIQYFRDLERGEPEALA
jgi:hypothetical protein